MGTINLARRRWLLAGAVAAAGAVAPVLAASGPGDSTAVTHRASSLTAGTLGAFTPSAPDPMLARLLAERPEVARAAEPVRFTPRAGQSAPATLTVATHARSVDLRANLRSASAGAPARPAPVVAEAVAPPSLSVRPSTYSLGRSVGWKAFSEPEKAARVDRALARAAGPVRGDEPKGKPSRFDSDFTLTPGSSPRAVVEDRSVQLDMSGRYRVSKSVDLKAGVRVRRDRDRLDPDVQDGPDSSAVYVGTAFRF